MSVNKFGRVNTYTPNSNMNIDKFGRHSYLKGEKPQSQNLLFLNENGDYDMNKKILHNIGSPKSLTDAVSKQYLEEHCISKGSNTNYDAKQKLIRNVQSPLLPGDVVTKRFLEKEALVKSFDGHYSAEEKRIINLRTPLMDNDAATKAYVEQETISKTTEGDYDLKNKRIRNVAEPELQNDVATAQYVQSKTPHALHDHWDFIGKRVSNIGDAVYDGEAVNLRTLKKMTPALKVGESIQVNNLKIIKLGDATDDTDAANLRVVRKEIEIMNRERDSQMSRFGAALFNYIHRSPGPPPALNINKDNYIDWNKVRVSENK